MLARSLATRSSSSNALCTVSFDSASPPSCGASGSCALLIADPAGQVGAVKIAAALPNSELAYLR